MTTAADHVGGTPFAHPSAVAMYERWPATRAALLGFGLTLALALDDGGYWPTSWGWAALGLAWLTAVTVVISDVRLGRLDFVALAALTGVLVWIGLSAIWTDSVTATAAETERAAVYVAGLATALTFVRARAYRALLAGVWVALTVAALYGLVTRLVPDRLGVLDTVANNRLAEPIGYWNGLGVFAVTGLMLALAFATRGRNLGVRATAAASLVPLAATLYFTYSRGAWVALGLGLVAALALDPRRLQFLTSLFVLAPWPGMGVWLASQSEALTRLRAPLPEASSDGHRLAVVLALLAAGAAAAAVALGLIERLFSIPTRVRRVYGIAVVVLIAVLLGGTFARYGSPPTLVERAYDDFTGPPRPIGNDLNRRLFDLSGSSRIAQWDVAWTDAREHPVLGSGAGTYEQYWNRDRDVPAKVRDAHSLYIEVLAELGPGGLAVLAVALLAPALAALRARSRRLVPYAFGAYVAFLGHAAVDWDWELPAVTLAALFCGAALLLAARLQNRGRPVGVPGRAVLAGAAATLALGAGAGLIGNSALDRMADALSDRDITAAEARAEKARRWAPWSSEPHYWLGYLDQIRGRRAAARRHYRDAVDRDPRVWELWLTLAGVSEGEERREALRRVRELNPLSGVPPERHAGRKRDASS